MDEDELLYKASYEAWAKTNCSTRPTMTHEWRVAPAAHPPGKVRQFRNVGNKKKLKSMLGFRIGILHPFQLLEDLSQQPNLVWATKPPFRSENKWKNAKCKAWKYESDNKPSRTNRSYRGERRKSLGNLQGSIKLKAKGTSPNQNKPKGPKKERVRDKEKNKRKRQLKSLRNPSSRGDWEGQEGSPVMKVQRPRIRLAGRSP